MHKIVSLSVSVFCKMVHSNEICQKHQTKPFSIKLYRSCVVRKCGENHCCTHTQDELLFRHLFIHFLFIQSVRPAARIVQLTRRVFRCMDQVETWNMQWNALWQLFAHFIPIYNPSVVYMLSHHEAFLKKIVQYSYLWSISSECIYWPVSLVQVVQSRGTRPPN